MNVIFRGNIRFLKIRALDNNMTTGGENNSLNLQKETNYTNNLVDFNLSENHFSTLNPEFVNTADDKEYDLGLIIPLSVLLIIIIIIIIYFAFRMKLKRVKERKFKISMPALGKATINEKMKKSYSLKNPGGEIYNDGGRISPKSREDWDASSIKLINIKRMDQQSLGGVVVPKIMFDKIKNENKFSGTQVVGNNNLNIINKEDIEKNQNEKNQNLPIKSKLVKKLTLRNVKERRLNRDHEI
jgi:hypothetical protein